MKYIKDIRIKTLEGFSLREVKTFPSMEWGEDGGIQADIYYMGAKVGTLFNDGNGGMATFYKTGVVDEMLLKTQALKCLKRIEPLYSQYNFLHNKTSKDVNEDDYDMLVALIVDKYAQGIRGTI